MLLFLSSPPTPFIKKPLVKPMWSVAAGALQTWRRIPRLYTPGFQPLSFARRGVPPGRRRGEVARKSARTVAG